MEKNYPNQIMLMGIFMKFSDLWDVKIEKNIHKKKKIITHKTVFIWFANLPTFTELQRFHYSQGKKIQDAIVQFSLSNTTSKP